MSGVGCLCHSGVLFKYLSVYCYVSGVGCLCHSGVFQVYSIVHGVLRLDLYEKLAGTRDLHINQELIAMCYADKAEESLVSKVRQSTTNCVCQIAC